MGTEGLGQQLQAQFAAQLEALAALQAGKLPVDSTVLAACRGRVPAAAVKELADAAAAAEADRKQRSAAVQATAAAKQEPQDLAAGAAADGDQPAGGQDGDTDVSAAEQLQAAIRAKLQRLAPQQRKLQREVLQERSQAQCSEFELLDWRRFRRPLPGANPRAFEPPQQPVALLMALHAARAQRAVINSRIDRLQLMRLHQEREEQQAQQPPQQQAQQHQQQQGMPAGGGGSMSMLPNPFSRAGAPQADPQPFAQQQDGWQQQQQQQQPEGQVDPAAALQHPHHQQLKQGAPGEVYLAEHAGANGTQPNGGHATAYLLQQSYDGQRAAG